MAQDNDMARHGEASTVTSLDWAQDQHEQFENPVYSTERTAFTTPPPRTGRPKSLRIGRKTLEVGQIKTNPSKRIYSIPTLMSLRASWTGKDVFAKINPEAICESLFNSMGVTRTLHLHMRSRELRELSDPGSQFNAQAHRQPRAPPPTSLLQHDTGFQRFLRTHASPPHQRVTAGGRIVPAGPLSPPPMFDFASLNEVARSQPNENGPSHQERHALNGQYLGINVPYQAVMGSSGYLPTDIYPPNGSSNPYFTPLLPNSTTHLASAVLSNPTYADGSQIVSFNGDWYRAYWNGVCYVHEPLQTTSSTTMALPDNLTLDPMAQQYANPYSSTKPPASKAASLQNKITKGSRQSSQQKKSSSELKDISNLEALSNVERALEAELKQLDREMALRHFELQADEHDALVARRVWLVNELDLYHNTRLAYERTHTELGKPRTAVKDDFDPQKGQPNGSDAKTVLSPAAPVFVPVSQQDKLESRGKLDGRGLVNHNVVAKDARVEGLQSIKIDNTQPSTELNHHNEESYDSVDSRDPSMRVVRQEQIEYAKKFVDDSPKRYCTTIPEFQEAIRRAREQARLYGCIGGHKGSPNDAEEDMRFAIEDCDPIPLPSQPPDHVLHPRPWNWNDTIFNYRREVQPSTRTSVRYPSGKASLSAGNFGPMRTVNNSTYDGQSVSHHPILMPTRKYEDYKEARNNDSSDGADQATWSKIRGRYLANNQRLSSISHVDKTSSGVKDLNGGMSLNHKNYYTMPTSNPVRRAPTSTNTYSYIDSDENIRIGSHSTKDTSHSEAKLGMPDPSRPSLGSISQPSLRKSSQYMNDHHYFGSKIGGEYRSFGMEDENNYAEHQAYRARSLHRVPQTSIFRRSGARQISSHANGAWNAPISESKSMWGPEEAARSPRVHLPRDTGDYTRSTMATKVGASASWNDSMTTQSNLGRSHTAGTKPSIVTGLPTGGSHNFLRGMLKDPRYGVACQTSRITQKSMTDRGQENVGVPAKQDWSTGYKDHNIGHGKVARGNLGLRCVSPSALNIHDTYNIRLSKTQSSLASSTYQARGHLPQYEGASKAHTSSIYNQNQIAQSQKSMSSKYLYDVGHVDDSSNNSHATQAVAPNQSFQANEHKMINSQSSANGGLGDVSFSHSQSQQTPNKLSDHHNPYAGYSYDGTGDEPPQSGVSSAEYVPNGHNDPNFDYKGLTIAAYKTSRPSVDNPLHHTQVDEFFNKIAKQERELIKAARAKNKTAP